MRPSSTMHRVVSAVVAVVSLWSAAIAAGADWAPPERLSENVVGAPSIAVDPEDPEGRVHVVWDTGSKIVSRIWRDGTWGAETTVVADPDAGQPSVAVGAGKTVVVWVADDELWAKYESEAPVEISDATTSGVRSPVVQYAPGVGFGVVWVGALADPGSSEALAALGMGRIVGGTWFGAEYTRFPESIDDYYYPSIDSVGRGYGRQGGLVIPFGVTGAEASGWIGTARWKGSYWDVTDLVSTPANGPESPDTSALEVGGKEIFAVSGYTGGHGSALTAGGQTVDYGGGTEGPELNRGPESPTLLPAADGGVDIVWLRDWFDGVRVSELMSSHSPDGSAWTDGAAITSDTSVARQLLRAAARPAGGQFLVWAQRKDASTPWRLWTTTRDIPPRPAPAISAVTPDTVPARSAATTITVDGTGFAPSSVIHWNGVARPTTYVGPTRLTATIPATELATAGERLVQIRTPAPGGGSSSQVAVTVTNPVPTVTGLSPTTATQGGGGFSLEVRGTGFVPTSVVRWNGETLSTSYGGPTEVTALVPAVRLETPGRISVAVFTPTPGGGLSDARFLTIAPTVPTGVQPPGNTAPPLVSGGSRPDDALVCSAGAWSGAPTAFTWTWLRDGAPIAGGPAYLIAPSDVGRQLVCRVTAENAGGAVAALSAVLTPLPSLPVPEPGGSGGGQGPQASSGGTGGVPGGTAGDPTRSSAQRARGITLPKALARRSIEMRARVAGRRLTIRVVVGADGRAILPAKIDGAGISSVQWRTVAGQWRRAAHVRGAGVAKVTAKAGTGVEVRQRIGRRTSIVSRTVGDGGLVLVSPRASGPLSWRTPAGRWRTAPVD